MVEFVVPEAPQSFAHYARMLEIAATTASTEAGFSPQWYEQAGTAWVIRRSAIDRAAPVLPGTRIEIVTWVADFRRVRSHREYEARADGGVVCLRARADWVYVERASGRPRRIPEAMIEGFVPEGAAPSSGRAALALGELPVELHEIEWVVDASDVDALEHVNNAKYFDYVEAAARTVVGADATPSRHDVEYVDEARAGDKLRGRAWGVSVSAETTETATEIRRVAGGALLTRARSAWLRTPDRDRERPRPPR